MKIKRILPPPDSLRGYPAGFISRYIAFLLDVLIIVAVTFIAANIARITLTFFGFDQFLPEANQQRTVVELSQTVMAVIRFTVTIIGGFLTFGVYSIVSWVLMGKTLGKALMGLRVLGEDGHRVKFRQALIRALSYYISGLALFAGFLWVLVDDRRQAWHDKLARTVVVYEWDAQYEERLVAAVQMLEDSNQRQQAMVEQTRRLAAEGDLPDESMEVSNVRTNDYPPL